MRTITIFADGGLGNRLGSLVGGLLTAKEINATPIIAWPQNNWCGCSFDSLFEPSPWQISEQTIHDLFVPNSPNIFLIHENQSNNVLEHVWSHKQENIEKLKNNTDNVIYYHNKVPSYFSEQQIINQLKLLKINSNVLNTVKGFCQHHGIDKNTVGLHLRKTDVAGLNEEKLYRQVIKQPLQKFFVCSDDSVTEKRFALLPNVSAYPKTHYVEKLILGNWNQAMTDPDGRQTQYNVNRNSQSVVEAFVDLLILSQTTIQYTIKSSFSKFAGYFTVE